MSLIKNAGFMSVAVFISRLMGLVREQVFAFYFGAGIAADAYLVAFRIPNLFRDLFAEGALSSAFVTVFAKSPTPEESRDLAAKVMTVMTVLLFCVCGSIFLFSPLIVQNMASDFGAEPGKLALTIGLTRLLSPFLFFVSSAALAMGILNSLGSFFVPAMGAAAFNVGNILVGGGLAFALRSRGPVVQIWGFGIGTLVGGFLQWSIQWPKLRQHGFSPWVGVLRAFSFKKIREAFADPGVAKVAKIMAPTILSVAAVQINVFVDTSFAAGLSQGSVSWLSYAYRIMYFPLGVFGVALSTATLPRLARFLRDKDKSGFDKMVQQALNWTQILALGSTAGLVVFGRPIVSLLYEHGSFRSHDTEMTAAALAAFSVGLIAFNSTKIFVQAFYALEAIWIPSLVSLLAIVLNYIGDLELSKIWGPAGIALATSLASLVNSFILMIVLQTNKKIKVVNLASLRVFFASLLGCAWMGVFYWTGISDRLVDFRHSHGSGLFFPVLIAVLSIAGAGYLAIVAGFTPEGRELFRTRILKRLRA